MIGWLLRTMRNIWDEDTDPDIDRALLRDPGQVTRNFHVNEWTCRDGTPVPREWWPRVQRLAENLEVLRAELGGRPIQIMSGYRTVGYNRAIGGARGSQHMYARAADIRVKGLNPRQVADSIEGLIRTGGMEEGGLGVYQRKVRRLGWVHYDIRGRRARWVG